METIIKSITTQTKKVRLLFNGFHFVTEVLVYDEINNFKLDYSIDGNDYEQQIFQL